MISDKIALRIAEAADAHKIDPAGLLAIVEVETNGKPFEEDNRTPSEIYEPHVAYRNAIKFGQTVLDAFTRAGLAWRQWRPATDYKDQRTSAQRLDKIRKARALHEETASRAASWGLGQTLGENYEELGFSSATELVEHQTGSVDGQIDCMLREIRATHLAAAINAQDWRHVAAVYNGKNYAANRYDEHLADAYKRNVRRLATLRPNGVARPIPPEQHLSRDEIEQIQARLAELGYHEVGDPDGTWGTRTAGAWSAFQAHEGLPVTGHYDDTSRDAFNAANARPVAPEREEADADDLRDAGSRTVAHADSVSLTGKLVQWAGLGGACSAGADKAGLLDSAKETVDKVGDLRGLVESASDVGSWVLSYWWIFALVIGAVFVYRAEQIIAARLDDHRTGRHAGT